MASVFLVEDETLIRMMVADMLADLGHTVSAEAADLADGLKLAASAEMDVAILDVQLGTHSSQPIAKVLQTRGIPFVFASGYGPDGLPEEFKGHPALRKPFPLDELDRWLASILP